MHMRTYTHTHTHTHTHPSFIDFPSTPTHRQPAPQPVGPRVGHGHADALRARRRRRLGRRSALLSNLRGRSDPVQLRGQEQHGRRDRAVPVGRGCERRAAAGRCLCAPPVIALKRLEDEGSAFSTVVGFCRCHSLHWTLGRRAL